MAVLMTPPYLQFFDANGAPLAGGKVYTYTATGTFSTFKATFTDEGGGTEHPNPIILDAAGKPATGNGSIWLSGTYDFRVTDADDVEIESTLDVTAFTALGAESDAYFETFSGTGAQTAFTTSEDLGTDEKAIYVWVDAGAGDAEGYVIQNPNTYTISGTTLTFTSAPASGTNNIYVSAPSLLVGAASSSASDAAASAAAALASENAAATSESNALAYASRLDGTSATSVAIGTGSKGFTTQADKFFDVGNFVLIASDADETNYMHGQVTAYSGTSLTVNVTNVGGSGTFTDWLITLSGTQGAKGDTGSISDLSGVPGGTIALSDKFIFDDVDDANATKSTTVSDVLVLAMPIGAIIDFAGTSLQTNYLACDGAAVSRTTYADLFTAIGTTWGVGDGSTTFNLPNLERRVTVGSGGSGTGTLGNSVGNTGGAETVALSSSNLPSFTVPVPTGGTVSATATNRLMAATNGSAVGNTNASFSGSSTAFNNMQPSAVVYKQIRYQ